MLLDSVLLQVDIFVYHIFISCMAKFTVVVPNIMSPVKAILTEYFPRFFGEATGHW